MLPPSTRFTDGTTRHVYTDERGQYFLDDGERVYGVWTHPDIRKPRPWLWIFAVLLCGCIVVLLSGWWLDPGGEVGDKRPPQRSTEDLRLDRDSIRREMAESIDAYKPNDPKDITDIGNDIKEILERLPGVERVTVTQAKGERTTRIIHVADCHYVPYSLFKAEVLANKPTATDQYVRQLYERFRLRVETVQARQEAVLFCLVAHHGLRTVHVEGLTPERMEAYRETLRLLADEREEDAKLRKDFDDLGFMDAPEASPIRLRIRELLDEHRRRRLKLGAVGLLAFEGRLDVQPLDDAETLDAAEPVNGRLDPLRQRKRDKAIVDRLDGWGVSVIVLGQDHDLADVVGDGVEVVRVIVKGLPE